jgi:hypothetical protein
MMTRTDKQVARAINRFMNYSDREKFYTATLNYWIRYDLTPEQIEMLSFARSRYSEWY